MPTSLTAAERRLRAQIAAHTLHSRVDGVDHTAPARAMSPSSLAYWERKVDPDGALAPGARARRAKHAKSAYFKALALKSAKARRLRGSGDEAA